MDSAASQVLSGLLALQNKLIDEGQLVASLWAWTLDTSRALADHRLIYLEYEGEISGQRGRVRRVDRGTYRALIWTPDRVHVELEGAQLVGEVELYRISPASGSAASWIFRMGNFD